jgi:hypothetical protein
MKRMAKVWFEGQPCIYPNPLDALADLEAFIKDGGMGEAMRVEIVEMTQKEFDALPEFEGW